jgi:hypothetical protein
MHPDPTEETSPSASELTWWSTEGTRRTFFGWMGRVGLGSVAGLAGLLSLETVALANNAPPCNAVPANWGCCSLNYAPPNCPTHPSTGQPTCPPDTIQTAWACCCPARDATFICMECVKAAYANAIPPGNHCCVSPDITACSGYFIVNHLTCASPNVSNPCAA